MRLLKQFNFVAKRYRTPLPYLNFPLFLQIFVQYFYNFVIISFANIHNFLDRLSGPFFHFNFGVTQRHNATRLAPHISFLILALPFCRVCMSLCVYLS